MEKTILKSLPERTADMLREMLYRENYRVGAKLPNELELAHKMQVSRSTLRQAIKILVDENLLEVERGSGTFVSKKLGLKEDPLGLGMLKDQEKLLFDLLQVRILIEPYMAALAAENATAEECQQLVNISKKLEDACLSGNNYYELDMEFHTYIAGCSKNLVIHNLYPAICNAILLQERVTSDRMRDQTLASHRLILDAILAKKSIAAMNAMSAHLNKIEEHMRQKLKDKQN